MSAADIAAVLSDPRREGQRGAAVILYAARGRASAIRTTALE
jgi:hypothetical protein